jgi:glycosyltransferase involved in cell wall biosynthesis
MCGLNKSKKTYVIPNTIKLTKVFAEKKVDEVLWVGHFDSDCKRPDLMLRAWSQIEQDNPRWELIMLGDGPTLVEMKMLASKLGLRRVRFKGRMPSGKYYQRAKIQCVTSTHEAFPLVLLEALQSKAVPIAFNSFPMASILIKNGQNGVLIKPFAVNDFSRALNKLMNNDDYRDDLMKNSEMTLKQFSNENVYKLWMNLFNTSV